LKYNKLFIVALVALLLDQLTKWIIIQQIPYGSYYPSDPNVVPVWDSIFYLVHIGNKGAAWGMFSDYSFIFLFLPPLALFGIFYFREALGLYLPIMQVIFGLFVGGIIGNYVDRIVHGHVIDFLDLHFPLTLPILGDRWPAFNIADSAICIGAGLYIYASFFLLEEPIQED